MSERRRFLRTLAAGPAGALLLPIFSQTGESTLAADIESVAEKSGGLPENIIYTKDQPGVWKGKDGGHLPQISASTEDDQLLVDVETLHGMSEKHYIVRHTIVSAEGEVLGAKTFHWKDEPVSQHKIKAQPGSDVYVLSYCNLHDLWLVKTRLET